MKNEKRKTKRINQKVESEEMYKVQYTKYKFRNVSIVLCPLSLMRFFIFFFSLFTLFFLFSCSKEEARYAPSVENRDSLPILKSIGVSTLISDSGIIRYKIISEDWFIYDKKDPTYWSFEKGLFLEKYNEDYHVDAYITADTAYYYDFLRLWELRGRVVIKNEKGETFKTSLLFWNQNDHRIYSSAFMEINGIEQQLSGYDFSSNESMTDYIIHASKGAFPMGEEKETPKPDAQKMQAMQDTTQQTNANLTTQTGKIQKVELVGNHPKNMKSNPPILPRKD